MEMVSVAKMRKATSRAGASREYAKYALEILMTLIKERSATHPLLEEGKGEATLLVIVASNKGLCGSYNINVSKMVQRYIKAHPGEKVECVVIGKQAEKIARRFNLSVVERFVEFKDEIDITHVTMLRNHLMQYFREEGRYKKVMVAYTECTSQMSYTTCMKSILPITTDVAHEIVFDSDGIKDRFTPTPKGMAEYIFEPSERAILDTILPDLVTTLLYQMMLEAGASEHCSRMFAMQNATRNATEIVDSLVLTYNRARQANITQEVAEIIAGAEALQTK
jgi:F-type H+-transporting ATPase subunit gamma